jgi:F1F0 ATPase subunit 2
LTISLPIALALLSGGLLGFVYFTGLWMTVRYVNVVRRPVILLLISVTIRLGLLLSGFYFIMIIEWYLMVVAVVGFLIVRQWFVYHLKPRSTHNEAEVFEWT